MKLNIVIDASGMFYRSLFTVGSYGEGKNKKLLDSKRSQGIFMKKLAMDFTSMVRDIEYYSRVVVCLDSSSWRKEILIENGAYKGDRGDKRDSTPVNWSSFFDLTAKFAEILSKKGYIVSKLPGAEADDLLYLWSRKFNAAGENTILVTGDRDLLQTLCKNENGTWTISLDPVNKRKKISLTQETFDILKNSNTTEPDIFDVSTWVSSNDILEKLTNEYDINIVNPMKVATMKVILGDGGDSVPGIISWPDKNPEKKCHFMTDNNYKKVISAYPIIENCSWKDLKDGKYLDEIVSSMESIKKISLDKAKISENIQRNCQLVVLSTDIIPKKIQHEFSVTYNDVKEFEPVTNKELLLEGTEWFSKNPIIPKSYDLFSD